MNEEICRNCKSNPGENAIYTGERFCVPCMRAYQRGHSAGTEDAQRKYGAVLHARQGSVSEETQAIITELKAVRL